MSGQADDRVVGQAMANMEVQLRIINGECTGATRAPLSAADRAVLERVVGVDLRADFPGEHPDSCDLRYAMGFYLAFLWRHRARLNADEFSAFVAQHSLIYARYVQLFGNTIELAPAVHNDDPDKPCGHRA